MKLYAKVYSDRANKGQGGNKYITIDLFIGNAKTPVPFADIHLLIEKNEAVLMVDDYEVKRQSLQGKKGKKEKGDN